MADDTVRHVLILGLRAGTTDAQWQRLIAAFRELTGKIEGIVSFEYGENNSPEGLSGGMTHIITLTFANAQARDAYLPHSEHRAFAQWLGKLGILEDLLVIDYTPRS